MRKAASPHTTGAAAGRVSGDAVEIPWWSQHPRKAVSFRHPAGRLATTSRSSRHSSPRLLRGSGAASTSTPPMALQRRDRTSSVDVVRHHRTCVIEPGLRLIGHPLPAASKMLSANSRHHDRVLAGRLSDRRRWSGVSVRCGSELTENLEHPPVGQRTHLRLGSADVRDDVIV